ncbi:hypothetical protein ACX80D_04975 [Arthrobacter sp. Sr24]
MKSKLTFLAGMAAGYVLGTRAGRGSYETIKVSAKELWNKDAVQAAVSHVQESVKDQAGQAAHKLMDQVIPAHKQDSDTVANPLDSVSDTPATTSGAPLDIVPEVSDEFPDAALNGGEGKNWNNLGKPSGTHPTTGI